MEPFLLRSDQPQLPQCFFIEDLLQFSDHLRGPPLDLVMGAPNLDAVLQMEPHEERTEGNNYLSLLCHPTSDTAKDTLGLLRCRCTLLAHHQVSTTMEQ